MSKKALKKTSGRKSTFTLKLKIPAEVKPLLDACSSHNGVSRESYIFAAIAGSLRCDIEYLSQKSSALDSMERGQA